MNPLELNGDLSRAFGLFGFRVQGFGFWVQGV